MQYSKPALTYEQQADLILSRGMTADRDRLIRRLKAVGYYRLCAYWHPFREQDDNFRPGTSIDEVWQRYMFDRQLRLILMDAIERVEVAARCALIDALALRHGPFAHLAPANFPDALPGRHGEMIDDLRDRARSSREVFVQHFRATYDEFPDLPIWVVAETMSFGTMFTLFKMSPLKVQKAVASRFSLPAPVFSSWLHTLNYVRNLCAHHSRVWNRTLSVKPFVPRHDARWHGKNAVPNDRLFVVLTQLRYLMQIVAPRSQWRERVFATFDRFQQVPLPSMGMPANWREHPLWL
ncbi:MAG TPA: Abi family protein [Vicinamibacterales bacterium]|nr:Abi family protein [Vicinamibacterales bacterium]